MIDVMGFATRTIYTLSENLLIATQISAPAEEKPAACKLQLYVLAI
jgi:hypothetical protein